MGSFNTRTFHVGVLADQKLNTLSLQYVLKTRTQEFLALVVSKPDEATFERFHIPIII